MMTKEETMKVIAEGVRPEEYCPIVDEVARQASYAFELAAESSSPKRTKDFIRKNSGNKILGK